MSLFRNLMLAKQRGGILPNGYLQLKALQVKSGQYINTGLVVSSIEPIEIENLKFSSVASACLLSAGSQDPQIILLVVQSYLFAKWYFSGSAPSSYISQGTEYHISLYGENDYYINNKKFDNLPAAVGGLPNTPLCLFKRTNQEVYFTGECGRITIGHLADYIPVQRYDGVCGYYDVIGKRFHTSADGTNFTPIYMD